MVRTKPKRWIDFQECVEIRITTSLQLNRFINGPEWDQYCRPVFGVLPHLLMDFQHAPGIVTLGYTFVTPFVTMYLMKKGVWPRSYNERMVQCEEGVLSRDEAIDQDGTMMPPAEIAERVAEVRAKRLEIELARDWPMLVPDWQGTNGPAIREIVVPRWRS